KTLIDAFTQFARKEIHPDSFVAAQDDAIRGVVAKQEAHGIPFLTDGEYRRLNWQVSFSEVAGWDLWETSWKGFLENPGNKAPSEAPLTKGEDAVVSFRAPATSRLTLVKSFPLGELKFLKSATKLPAKITLMGPDRVCQMCDIEGSRAVYKDADAFLADVVAIQKQMIDELVAADCDYIQIDEPSFTGYVDPPTLERMRAKGEDPLKNLRRAIEADNAVIAGIKGKAITGLHICRGNRASMWHREGKYDAIAEALFGGLHYDRLLLEYDTERAGGFEPLRFVPKGVVAVLGLITTKTGQVETVDGLRRRLDDAARYLPLDQIALSPQCGFASGIAGNMLSEDEQWRKLDVMAETARRVWH
ncbi:MAG: 5-methyltetrahydropteroyltriglutamate--homocysteine S-methyltransferase, partial [Alphaproteobacteria bacterium]